MNQLSILSIILCMVTSIFILLLIYRHFFYTYKEHITATFPDGIVAVEATATKAAVGSYNYGQTPIHNIKFLDKTKNPTDAASWVHHASLPIGESLGKSMPNASSFITEHPVIMDENLYNILAKGGVDRNVTIDGIGGTKNIIILGQQSSVAYDTDDIAKVTYNKAASQTGRLLINGIEPPDKKIFYIKTYGGIQNQVFLYETYNDALNNTQNITQMSGGGGLISSISTFTHFTPTYDLEDWHIALFIIMFHQYSLLPDTTVGNTHKYSLFNALLAIESGTSGYTTSIGNLNRIIQGLHHTWGDAGGLWTSNTAPTFESTVNLKDSISELIIDHFSNGTVPLTVDNVNNIAKCFKHSLCNHANNELPPEEMAKTSPLSNSSIVQLNCTLT